MSSRHPLDTCKHTKLSADLGNVGHQHAYPQCEFAKIPSWIQKNNESIPHVPRVQQRSEHLQHEIRSIKDVWQMSDTVSRGRLVDV